MAGIALAEVRDPVQVQLDEHDREWYVLARRDGRQAKEIAIRRKRLGRRLRKRGAMRRSLPSRDQFLRRIGAAKQDAGRSFSFVKLTWPADGTAVTRASFHFRVDKPKLKPAEHRDGHDLRRSN